MLRQRLNMSRLRIKISEKQKELLVDFIKDHPGIGYYNNKSKDSKELWDQLTKVLNLNGENFNGAIKNLKQWQQSWKDLKMAVKAKDAEIKKGNSVTELTYVEKNILNLLAQYQVENDKANSLKGCLAKKESPLITEEQELSSTQEHIPDEEPSMEQDQFLIEEQQASIDPQQPSPQPEQQPLSVQQEQPPTPIIQLHQPITIQQEQQPMIQMHQPLIQQDQLIILQKQPIIQQQQQLTLFPQTNINQPIMAAINTPRVQKQQQQPAQPQQPQQNGKHALASFAYKGLEFKFLTDEREEEETPVEYYSPTTQTSSYANQKSFSNVSKKRKQPSKEEVNKKGNDFEENINDLALKTSKNDSLMQIGQALKSIAESKEKKLILLKERNAIELQKVEAKQRHAAAFEAIFSLLLPQKIENDD